MPTIIKIEPSKEDNFLLWFYYQEALIYRDAISKLIEIMTLQKKGKDKKIKNWNRELDSQILQLHQEFLDNSSSK